MYDIARCFFDPASGERQGIGYVARDSEGDWQSPLLPTFADWMIVLQRKG